jgi:hypothetical protein
MLLDLEILTTCQKYYNAASLQKEMEQEAEIAVTHYSVISKIKIVRLPN